MTHSELEEAAAPAAPPTDTATRETLEDYTLRFAPRSYRKWSTGVVATSALGGIAYLADFAIGANIGISYGTTNALWGIAVFAVVIILTGIPVAYYAARYNLDLDLITRGSGFGYYGSVVTNVIFATFTFIFFALEGAIMAQGLELGLGIPLWLGYALSTVIIFPLVVYGMKALSTLQVWTTPLWLLLMVVPFGYCSSPTPSRSTPSSPTAVRTTGRRTWARRCWRPACACRSSRRSPSRSTTCASCRRRRRRTRGAGGPRCCWPGRAGCCSARPSR